MGKELGAKIYKRILEANDLSVGEVVMIVQSVERTLK